MLASINGFQLADETISGGMALSQVRFNVQRIFDIVVALNEPLPVLFDRGVRKTVVDFQVTRVHATLAAADTYVALHDASIPSSGPVQFTATDGSIRYLLAAFLIQHERIGGIGKTTTHSYHIEGGRINLVPSFYILTEDSGFILLETGGKIKLEH